MSVQPSPPPRQILANGQQIILPFLCRSRSARSTNWRSGISRSAHLYKLHFVSFVVRSATLKKPRNGGNFRDRMCNCITAHARLYDYHLVRAAPRHPRHRAKGRHFRIDAYCGGFAEIRSCPARIQPPRRLTLLSLRWWLRPQNNAQLSRL